MTNIQVAKNADFLVAALYHFTPLPEFETLREPIQELCDAHAVRGTLLLVHEGINGTISGPDAGIAAVLAGLEHKESRAQEMPFHRMKMRLKKEIVTMGVEGIDPLQSVGTYVDPQDWNALISDPGTIVIDTRNDYETAIGQFKGAVDSRTGSFREFPDWVRNHPELSDKPKIAMYCTGCIRCQKATAFMKAEGFEDVYHLRGGILKYLEEVPEDESLWDGACFVFDQRVSITHGLEEDEHRLVPRLSLSAHGRRNCQPAVRGRRVLPLLPRGSQRRRPGTIPRAAKTGGTGPKARSSPHRLIENPPIGRPRITDKSLALAGGF